MSRNQWLAYIAVALCIFSAASPLLYRNSGFDLLFSITTGIFLLLTGSIFWLKSLGKRFIDEDVYSFAKAFAFAITVIYFCIAWPSVVKRYFYPDKKIFTNSTHHVLRHTGFAAKDSFTFISRNKISALFEKLQGEVIALRSGNIATLITDQPESPLFYAIDKLSATKFLNPFFIESIKNKITISTGGVQFVFHTEIISKTKARYSFSINNRSFTTDFSRPLDAGFINLKSILTGSSVPDNLLDSIPWLDQCMLIKSDYNFAKNEAASKKTRYHLFPSPVLRQLIRSGTVAIRFDENIAPGIRTNSQQTISGKSIYLRTGNLLDGDPLYKITVKGQMLDINKERPYEIYRLPSDTILPLQINISLTSQKNFSMWKSKFVMLNDFFESSNHQLHCNSILSFIHDKAGVSAAPITLLDFNAGDTLRIEKIKPGQEFFASASRNTVSRSGIFWKFSLEDLVGQNPVNKSWLLLFPVWFLVCFLGYYLIKADKGNPNFSIMEASLHLGLLLLLSFKLWLLWRYFAFPPTAVEGATQKIKIDPPLNINLLSSEKMIFIIPPLIYFVLSIAELLKKAIVSVFILPFTRLKDKSPARFSQWLTPLLLLILFIILCLAKKYIVKGSLVSVFILATAAFFVYVTILYRRGLLTSLQKWVLMLFCLLPLVFAETGLAVIYAHALACYYLLYFAGYRKLIYKKRMFAGQLVVFLLCILFLIPPVNRQIWSFSMPFFNYMGMSENTKFRASILSTSPEKAFLETELKKEELSRFFNAYDNIQFIEYYSHLQGGKSHKPFSLLPHQKTGVKFKDQASDLVVSRFIVAEHGKYLILVFLLCLLLPVAFAGFDIIRWDNMKKNIPYFDTILFAGSLLFMSGYYVYACNMNILPFVGQDFPFLSITSYTTYLVPLLLILVMLYFINHSKPEHHGRDEINS